MKCRGFWRSGLKFRTNVFIMLAVACDTNQRMRFLYGYCMGEMIWGFEGTNVRDIFSMVDYVCVV